MSRVGSGMGSTEQGYCYDRWRCVWEWCFRGLFRAYQRVGEGGGRRSGARGSCSACGWHCAMKRGSQW